MATVKYSVQLADATKKTLDKREVAYEFIQDQGVFKFSIRLQKAQKLQSVQMYVRILETALTAHAVLRISADESNIDSVVEYITRANYGLTAGCFEVDYNDGEVRYKNHNRFENRIPSDDELHRIVLLPVIMWERYGNGLLKVMFGGASPKSAIEEAENS